MPPNPAKPLSHTAPRVCVIGAGCSGLTATKALVEAGAHVTCFEMGSRPGGLWLFDNDNGRGGAYRSLHINTSRRQMQFSDFPMSEGAGDYPAHEAVARYLTDYARAFGLHDAIEFRTRVVACHPSDHSRLGADARGYRVQVEGPSGRAAHHFDAVVVANGHHWDPRWPEAPNPADHEGLRIHSHQYVDPNTPLDLRQRKVLVVGMGNSAVDIASELSRSAAKVILSTRRPTWVIPKYLFGRPVDEGTIIPRWLPTRLRQQLTTWGFRWAVGSMRDFGLPEPDHLLGSTHPTLSSELPALVRAGSVEVRGAVTSFAGRRVDFSWGASEDVEAIVYCTGYRVSFPFLSEHHLSAPDNELPLFFRVFHPARPRLFFVGLAQPTGAIMPLAELQGRWIAEYVMGRYNLPDREQMRRAIARVDEQRRRQYTPSPRHTMQIDPHRYRKDLTRELKAGRRRSRAGRGQAFLFRPGYQLA